MLNSLPPTLDKTYERILCNIDDQLVKDARRILTLLCFALRPLKVQELIDGIAVEIKGSTGLNRKHRLQDSDDIRNICLGLVDIGISVDYSSETDYDKNVSPTVRIAHFSIEEYLVSERIHHQKAAIFSLSSVTAHAEIAQICLVYLLENGLSSSNLNQDLIEEFPLPHFAAMYWYRYYRNMGDLAPGLDSLIVKLFKCQHSFATWVKLHDIDRPGHKFIEFSRQIDTIATPVYYASLLGLDQALSDLIDEEQAGSVMMISKQINARGGEHGNALQAASYGGHKKVV